MPQPFAKLFETEEFGQILVMLQEDADDRPELRFTVQPEGLGLCSVGLAYPETDKGSRDAEAAFRLVDLEMARDFARDIFKTALPLRGAQHDNN